MMWCRSKRKWFVGMSIYEQIFVVIGFFFVLFGLLFFIINRVSENRDLSFLNFVLSIGLTFIFVGINMMSNAILFWKSRVIGNV